MNRKMIFLFARGPFQVPAVNFFGGVFGLQDFGCWPFQERAARGLLMDPKAMKSAIQTFWLVFCDVGVNPKIGVKPPKSSILMGVFPL